VSLDEVGYSGSRCCLLTGQDVAVGVERERSGRPFLNRFADLRITKDCARSRSLMAMDAVERQLC
jgi:hypothetical protein